MYTFPNLNVFFESSKKYRGGRAVWWKDSNGENRRNTLLGCTIKNPSKGLGHLYAAQLLQYTLCEEGLLFRSFAVKANSTGTTIKINGDGFSDVPEVGMVLMIAPDDAATEGQSTLITAVAYDSTNSVFNITVDTALTVTTDTILVEAVGTAASATATVLVPNPNTFIEADTDTPPTDGSFGITNVNVSIHTVFDKLAFTKRMQPLPKYVLAKNRSYIDGVFWI